MNVPLAVSTGGWFALLGAVYVVLLLSLGIT
jgi:hypothetical protein